MFTELNDFKSENSADRDVVLESTLIQQHIGSLTFDPKHGSTAQNIGSTPTQRPKT